VLFGAGLVLVILFAYIGYRAKQRRMLAFQTLARAHGMTYVPSDRTLLDLPFPLLSSGNRRGVENVLRGPVDGIELTVFDYWYETESTDAQGRTTTSTWSFDCVSTTYDASGPRLSIAEENVLTRLADALAMDDVRFESEEFNDAFNVKGEDERFATALIDARMMAWLLANGRDHSFQVVGDRILVSRRRVRVEEIPSLMTTAVGFVRQIPTVVGSLYPKSG